jgi:hypothetical protein
MRWKYYTAKLIEVIIIFASNYLAITSFFHSFIYSQAKMFVADALSKLNITYTFTSINTDTILSQILSVLVFITAIYYWLFGSRDKIITIYHFNMLLFIPEALSFSKLEWLRLFDIPGTLFTTDRSFTTNLITAFVIVGGYITLFMTNRFLEIEKNSRQRGALRGETDLVFINQSTISYLILFTSILIMIGAAYIVPMLQNQVHTILQTQQYRYLILGVISTILISASLLMYYREQIN